MKKEPEPTEVLAHRAGDLRHAIVGFWGAFLASRADGPFNASERALFRVLTNLNDDLKALEERITGVPNYGSAYNTVLPDTKTEVA